MTGSFTLFVLSIMTKYDGRPARDVGIVQEFCPILTHIDNYLDVIIVI